MLITSTCTAEVGSQRASAFTALLTPVAPQIGLRRLLLCRAGATRRAADVDRVVPVLPG